MLQSHQKIIRILAFIASIFGYIAYIQDTYQTVKCKTYIFFESTKYFCYVQ